MCLAKAKKDFPVGCRVGVKPEYRSRLDDVVVGHSIFRYPFFHERIFEIQIEMANGEAWNSEIVVRK